MKQLTKKIEDSGAYESSASIKRFAKKLMKRRVGLLARLFGVTWVTREELRDTSHIILILEESRGVMRELCETIVNNESKTLTKDSITKEAIFKVMDKNAPTG